MNRIGLQVLLVAVHRQLELAAPALPAVQSPAAALVKAAGRRARRGPQDRPRVALATHGVFGEREQATRDAAGVVRPGRADLQLARERRGHRPASAACSATSTAASGRETTSMPGPASILPGPLTVQLWRATTVRPRARAKAISDRVPHSP